MVNFKRFLYLNSGITYKRPNLEDEIVEVIRNDFKKYKNRNVHRFGDLRDKPKMPDGGDIISLVLHVNGEIKYPKGKGKKPSDNIHVRFILDKRGNIAEIKVLNTIGKEYDKEAERAIKSMPQWTTATLNEKKIRVYCVVPITFDPKPKKILTS